MKYYAGLDVAMKETFICILGVLNHHASFIPSTIRQVFKQDRSFLAMVYQDRGLSQLQAEYARCEQFASYHGPVGITKGQIAFSNVKFHYKGTAPLFQNKSVTIEVGQKVGHERHGSDHRRKQKYT